MLKKEFFAHPEVLKTKEIVEQQVLSSELSPFSGASLLMDAFRAPIQPSE
jgi:hypothetical protein